MENDNPTTEYTVMPTIQWENKKPSQIFISADKAKPIRTELREMVNHEDSDVRDQLVQSLNHLKYVIFQKKKMN